MIEDHIIPPFVDYEEAKIPNDQDILPPLKIDLGEEESEDIEFI
jgi:hypothetical protein